MSLSKEKIKEITLNYNNSDLTTITNSMNISNKELFKQLSVELIDQLKQVKSNLFLSEENFLYLCSLINFFQNLYHYLGKKTSIIELKLIEEIIRNCIEICKFLVIDHQKINFKTKKFFNACHNLFKRILLYDNNLLFNLIFKDESLSNTLFSIVSENYEIRHFIYEMYNLYHKDKVINDDFKKNKLYMNYVIENIRIKYKPEYFKEILDELKIIDGIFIDDFQLISHKYLSCVVHIIHLNIDNDENIKKIELFYEHIVLDLFVKNNFNLEVGDFIFNLFTKLIFEVNNPIIYELLVSKLFSCVIDKEKYTKLINNHGYIEKFLKNIPKIKDENIMNVYLSTLLKLIHLKYSPIIDLKLIIQQLDIYLNNPENNMNILNILIYQFNKILDNDPVLINYLLNEFFLFSKIKEIIHSQNPKISKEIKIRSLEFLELILMKNDDKYEFTIPYNIELGNDFISLRLNYILTLYEEDNEIYNEKMSKLISIIQNRIIDKKAEYALDYFNLLFSIIKSKKCIYLNIFDSCNKINSLLYQLSGLIINEINNRNDSNNQNLLNRFLKIVLKFIFEYNKKIIKYKLNKIKPINETEKIFQSPKIFDKKTLKTILKTYFDSTPLIRKETIQFLLSLSIENKLIVSPYLITQMIKLFFKDKNYSELHKLIQLLNELFEFDELNIKMMLKFSIIPIFIKVLLEIPENEKYNIVIKKAFKTICKYLNRYHLEKYMLQIYSECMNIKNALINKIEYSKEFFQQLIELLKESLKNSSEETLNSIVISKNCYLNPLIYNMLYIHEIYFFPKNNNEFSIYLNLKISSYKNISDFSFCTIENNSNKLEFLIDINNKLNVIEKNINNSINTICSIEQFNEIVKCDKVYHQILIRIHIKEKNISLFIDDVEIFTEKYKLFSFVTEWTNFYIGYEGNNCENISNKLKINQKNNVAHSISTSKNELENPGNNEDSFVTISYLLISNCDLSMNTFNNLMKKNKIINGKNNKLVNLNSKDFLGLINNENIIAEVLFNNQNIKLINLNKLEDLTIEFKQLNFIDYEDYINKYIPYIEFYNNYGTYNKLNKIYFLSKNDTITEFISYNQIYQIEKIHKGIIKNKLFTDYGLDISISNSFFIDFFIGIIYEYDRLNLEDMSFFSENILDLLKIILSIDNKNILDYFFYENDIMKIKLKIFFERNKNILNEENFIDNLIRIFQSYNIDGVFILYKKILIDEFIFNEIQDKNTVLSSLHKNLSKISNNKLDSKFLNILYKIYLHLYKIENYFELSLIENNDGLTVLDLIISCQKLIIKLLFNSSEKYNYVPLIKNNILDFLTITKEIDSEINNHKIKVFELNYSQIFDKINNFITSENINSQRKKALKFLLEVFFNEMKNYPIKNIDQEPLTNEKCFFCEYVSYYIKMNFFNIENNIKFLKYKSKYFSNAYLNYLIYQNKINPERFAWYLSDKEGISRIRNKFVFKENDFYSFEKEVGKNKFMNKMYKYEFSKEKFEEYYSKLNQILIYDSICDHYHFYNNLTYSETFEKDSIISNCLYLKRIQKTNSIFILTQKYIFIYTNLIIDQNGIIYVNNGTLSNGFWTKTQQDSFLELNTFIKNKCDIYRNNFNELDNRSQSITYMPQSKFGFDYNYKLVIKKIPLRKITEIYKRNHLHVENSIEIFLKNGSSFFFVFNIDKRDDIFFKIISNLNTYYQKIKKQPSIVNFNPSENKNPYLFYLKNCPIKFFPFQLKTKNSKNPKINSYQVIFDTIKIANDPAIRENWINLKITNFDYIMLLNTLSGRSYNDFSQYLIFPWILQNFNTGSELVENSFGEYYLNIIKDQLYRNLYYPIFAQSKEIRKNLKLKYDLKDEDSRYHSGTFYSTHAFVCYFLIRQRPFTEIHLEIQGGQFDTGDRLFIGENQLSILDEKYQELIPALFTVPELYFNTNHFDLGRTQNKRIVDNFELPNWCKNDPRLFCLFIKKMLEGKKINENIHHWFDLIFGFRQDGIKALEVFNTYRNACYKMNENQIKEMNLNNTINDVLLEKEELGCMPNLLFTKEHPKRIKTEWINKTNIFFDSFEKLSQCKIQKIINWKSSNAFIKGKKIVDFVPLDENILLYNNNYYQGGICSLSSLINSLNKKNDEVENFFGDNKIYAVITKGNIFCGKKKKKYLTFHEKYLILVKPLKNKIYNYFIGENTNITSITCNDKGNKIYVGFENGNIKEYQVKKNLNNVNIEPLKITKDPIGLLTYERNDYFIISKNSLNLSPKKKDNIIDDTSKKIYIYYTGFSFNFPNSPIKLLKLNEAFNILISIDTSNTINLISINNNFQLLHNVKYLTNTKQSIKDIIIIPSNGDFLVYTSLTVYLFSINGIPLSVLYLTDKAFDYLSPITFCTAVSLYDVVLFLSHKGGYISIWKVVNRDQNENLFERTSHNFNQKTSKYFLNDYNYGYNINDKAEKKGESELIRKFDMIIRIEYDSDDFFNKDKNIYFNFMKMSYDMSYLILIDNKNDFYILNCVKNKKEINDTLKKMLVEGFCVICKRDLAERVSRMSQNNLIFQKEEDRNICDDCRKHLTRCDNLLYGY